MTPSYVVLIDDQIGQVVAGAFAGKTSADDYVRELAEALAGAGLSATVRSVALIPGTLPIVQIVDAFRAQRDAEIHRLQQASGVAPASQERRIG